MVDARERLPERTQLGAVLVELLCYVILQLAAEALCAET